MKIGYLVSAYPALNHTYILREIRALRDFGFEVETISMRPADRPYERLTPEEREEAENSFAVKAAPVSAVAASHLGVLLRRPSGYLGGLARALSLAGWSPKRWLRYSFYFVEAVVAGARFHRAGVQHFHVHFSATVGLLLCRVFPMTMSATVHGSAEFDDPAAFHLTLVIREARFLVAISFFGRSRMLKISPPEQWSKIEVCRLGVDPTVFQPRPFRENPEQFELICVGQLAPAKAHQLLLEALVPLAQEGFRFRLRIVGEGPLRPVLEQQTRSLALEDYVEFTGGLDQDELRACYRETDIFALASFDEGIPVVLMEAMAMEIACVATHITGVPELIHSGTDGILVPPSDVAGFAEAVRRLFQDPALRRRLGEAGRQRVEKKYDLRQNSRALAQIMERRLAAR